MSAYTADQIATIVKIAAKKDMPDLGEDSDQEGSKWVTIISRLVN